MNIINSFHLLTDQVKKAQAASPIAAREVIILAASKAQSAVAIEQAIAAGIGCFGENRVQEAEDKWLLLKEKYPHIPLHLIGQLQTNKVKQALSLFNAIQTLDRVKLADEIAKHPETAAKQFYIQVNTGKEPQKAGVAPDEADGFIAYCQKLGLPVVGLMCVPPADQVPAPHFAVLHEMAKRNGLAKLSMGMSGDYETAVRMGSTCVRIGTALFGERS